MDDNQTIADIEKTERKRKRHARRLLKLRLLAAWVALVALYFLWEAWAYRGLYAMFAEWQFYMFGRYLPIISYTLLVALFGLPALLLALPRRSRYKRARVSANGPDFVLGAAMQFRHFLLAFAGGLGIASLVTLLFSLTLPSIHPPERTITVGAADSVAPQPGPAALKGDILYTRTSAFSQDMLLTRRGARFAPVMAPGGDGQSIRYFVELPPTHDADPAAVAENAPPQSGVLMRNALPGSIVKLYGYAGYRVEHPYYVLYTSDRTLRWSYYVTAAQLALAALIVLAAAAWQHRRVRQVRTTLEARTVAA